MNVRKDHFIIKMLLAFLCLAMALAGAGMAEAGDTGEEMQYMSCAMDDGLDGETCFEAYIADMFDLSASTYAQRRVGNSFTGDLRIFYDFLSECIREVAAVSRTSTVFTIDYGFTLDGDGLSDLLGALLADHPAELYWFNKVAGYSVSYNSRQSTFRFSVNVEYATGEYEVDPTAVMSAQAAVARAEDIISQYTSVSDYEKLAGYKDAICSLVSYNDDAADNFDAADSNAWQLVWVFDGDSNTNVVCEGYAKAFQYLCDRTNFAGDVCCYSVTGYMGASSGGGDHMWNLVHMPNGKVYLADITNCDSGTIGADDLLFMAGYYSGSAMDGYIFRCDYGNSRYEDVIYAYDLDMWNIFSKDDLTVTDTEFLSPLVDSGSFGSVVWQLDTQGVLTISGSGSIPVSAFSDDLRFTSVRIQEGITEINNFAFLRCRNLEEIYLPASLTKFGVNVLTSCDRLKKIEVSEDNVNFSSEDCVLYDKSKQVVYACPSNAMENGFTEGVNTIGAYALSGNISIRSLKLPQSLTTIGTGAFSRSSLQSIVIPSGVTSIGNDMLLGNSSLVSATFLNDIQAIPAFTFSMCGNLKEVILPSGLVEIGKSAFFDCISLKEIEIPDIFE